MTSVFSQGSASFTIAHTDASCKGPGYLEALTGALQVSRKDVRVARCALLAARCTPASLQGGMVLTMSVWGDAGSDMSWLDVSRVAGCSSCRL